MKISFVIPCYNEAGNVKPLAEEIEKTFRPESVGYELIFVNDGSTDGTRDALRELVDTSAFPVTAVHFSRNFGKEAAMYAGLCRAEGDLVCIIDADLQQPPEVALEMYRMLESQPEIDVVAAYQKARKESVLLKFFKKSFYSIINKMSDVEFVPAASDFRMFRRTVLDAILSMKEYYRFSKGIFAFVGFETAALPYDVRERLSGKSKWSIRSLFRYSMEGIIGYTTKPLRFATGVGCFFTIASVLMLITLLILGISGVAFPETLITVGVIAFFFGILEISLGIIGEYLMRTYMQGKERPVYIEKEVWKGKSNG